MKKRVYVYRCKHPSLASVRAGGSVCGELFIPSEFYFEGVKGPQLKTVHPHCPNDACLGAGEFVAVYVPEGSPPPHPAKAGKNRKRT